MPPKKASGTRSTSAAQVPCQYCGKSYDPRGVKTHESRCRKDREGKLHDLQYGEQQREEDEQRREVETDGETDVPNPFDPQNLEDYHVHESPAMSVVIPIDLNDEPEEFPPTPQLDPQDQVPQKGDIRIEFHPNANRPTKLVSADEFIKLRSPSADYKVVDEQPWLPFRNRHDFRFAHVCLKSYMNDSLVQENLEMHREASIGSKVTFERFVDVKRAWEKASGTRTNFENTPITVKYPPFKEDPNINVDFYKRDLWEWSRELVEDPNLADHFAYDAERLSRFDGEKFVPFIDEPWTASRFWKYQSDLPVKDGKLLAFIVYADKNKLSSFGSARGYPIIARLANLLSDIRNGIGVGGGRVVGWIEVVEDWGCFKNEHKKKAFIKFKHAVWHESFLKLLESIASRSHTGDYIHCGDGVLRLFFALILILCADYEEQCVMSLIRGSKCLYPCPKCLIPKDMILKHPRDYPFRNIERVRLLLEESRQKNITEGDSLLKEYGLRDQDNAFGIVARSDPHHALSFDELHSNKILFDNHLMHALKEHVDSLPGRSSRDARNKINEQLDALPRWRNMYHFTEGAMDISFNDGSKHEALSKQILFAAYNVFDPSDKVGFLLLKAIRAYIKSDMYICLSVHTEETIRAGEKAVTYLGECLQEYVDACEVAAGGVVDSDDDDEEVDAAQKVKSWNFPKAHLYRHAFEDIKAKGVTKHLTTRMNEKMHGPIRRAYLLRSNFKQYTGTILNIDHCFYVAEFMSERLNDLDEHLKSRALNAKSSNEDPHEDEDDTESDYFAGHATFGSCLAPVRLEDLEIAKQDDLAFRGFRGRLTNLVNKLPNYGVTLPQYTKLDKNDKIQEFRFLKVHYESLINWRPTTDYLRAHPAFHNRPRFDCVMIDSGKTKPIFGRLVMVFKIPVKTRDHGSQDIGFVLLQTMSPAPGIRSSREKALGMIRVFANPRRDAEVFLANSIIRGAVMAPDPEQREKDGRTAFLVMDTVDEDMLLRVERMRF